MDEVAVCCATPCVVRDGFISILLYIVGVTSV